MIDIIDCFSQCFISEKLVSLPFLKSWNIQSLNKQFVYAQVGIPVKGNTQEFPVSKTGVFDVFDVCLIAAICSQHMLY